MKPKRLRKDRMVTMARYFVKTKTFWMYLFLLSQTLIFLSSCETIESCDCASPAIQLMVQDENSNPIFPDSVEYTQNGALITIEDSELQISDIWIGWEVGTFHIWATYGDQQWESEDVEVAMGGPEDCRLPNTQEIVVTFATNDTSSNLLTVGSDCWL